MVVVSFCPREGGPTKERKKATHNRQRREKANGSFASCGKKMDGCWMVHFIAPADIVQLMATGDGEGGESIFPVRTRWSIARCTYPPTTVMGTNFWSVRQRNSGQKLQRSGELLGENFLIPRTSWNLDSAWSIRTRGPAKLFRQFRRDYNFIIRQPRVKLCRNFRRFRTVSLWISIDFTEFVLFRGEVSQRRRARSGEGEGRLRGEKNAFLWFLWFSEFSFELDNEFIRRSEKKKSRQKLFDW